MLEQFLKLPETEPASEFHDGKIVQRPMPAGKHSRLQSRWVARINAHAEPRGLGEAFPELRCTFAGRSIVPDVSFIASKRIPQDASGRIADDFRIAPDLAIEIVSPKQSLADLEEKLSFCVRNGSRLGFMVDPYSETLQVFRPDAPPRRLDSGPIDLSPVIPGLQLTVEEVFDWLRPRR